MSSGETTPENPKPEPTPEPKQPPEPKLSPADAHYTALVKGLLDDEQKLFDDGLEAIREASETHNTYVRYPWQRPLDYVPDYFDEFRDKNGLPPVNPKRDDTPTSPDPPSET